MGIVNLCRLCRGIGSLTDLARIIFHRRVKIGESSGKQGFKTEMMKMDNRDVIRERVEGIFRFEPLLESALTMKISLRCILSGRIAVQGLDSRASLRILDIGPILERTFGTGRKLMLLSKPFWRSLLISRSTTKTKRGIGMVQRLKGSTLQ